MRTIIQRVSRASVTIDGELKSAIGTGLLVFLGVEEADGLDDVNFLVKKIAHLRVFDDENGVMNRSLQNIGGELLCVSQFTLHASIKKGNRPSYIKAAKSNIAIPLYECFCQNMSHELNKKIQTGVFGADMQVELINNGPVTIWMDSKVKE